MHMIGIHTESARAWSCTETKEARVNRLSKHSDYEYVQPDDNEYDAKSLHEFGVLFRAGELAGNIYAFPKPLLEYAGLRDIENSQYYKQYTNCDQNQC